MNTSIASTDTSRINRQASLPDPLAFATAVRAAVATVVAAVAVLVLLGFLVSPSLNDLAARSTADDRAGLNAPAAGAMQTAPYLAP